jgi:hypothetical protein
VSEQKEKTYKTEWTFDFDKVGESINRWLGSVTDDVEVKTGHYAEPVGAATSARVEIGLSLGTTTIKASESGNLFDADVEYAGTLDFNVSGETEKSIKLHQSRSASEFMKPVKEAIHAFANRSDLRWDIGISPNIPVDLSVDGGVGPATLDLSGLQLTNLKIGGSVGELHVTLPATGNRYDARIEGGVGHTHVTFEDGAVVHLRVEGGVGEVDIRLPANAPARVKMNGGIGGANLPPTFKRISDGSDFITTTGVWETDNFTSAITRIEIEFNGGVGSLKVQ